MQSQSITAIATEFSCTQSTVVASLVSSLITAIITASISVIIHLGVWFYRNLHSNEPGHQVCQGESNEDVYEKVDDKAVTTTSMKTNEAYGTTVQ